jgi:tRNA/rRNA methyltransferase
MPETVVVLVGPKNEGNIGAVARAMKNFGVGRLLLVDPCPIGDEAFKRAMHGADVLARAKTVESLDEALRGVDVIAGTTGIATRSEKKFLRIALMPWEFAERAGSIDGTLAVLLGREDFGLSEADLERCDLLVSIPSTSRYPILNVSHAAAIVLYELFAAGLTSHTRDASGAEKEFLHAAFRELLDATNYPAHKKGRTQIMFRRLMGRATPSKWEFHALMGVFTRATKTIRRQKK